jgi:hypothetical protein
MRRRLHDRHAVHCAPTIGWQGGLMQDVLLQNAVTALYSLVMGYLAGALVYVISGALWPRDQALGAPSLPRAVLRVPESRCRSVRCALTRPEQSEHLVEVRILERGATLIKVEWPRAFRHLEAWTYASDVVDELSADSNSLAVDLERWLSALDRSEDAGDAHSLPTPTAADYAASHGP